jgi:hypothetical protein
MARYAKRGGYAKRKSGGVRKSASRRVSSRPASRGYRPASRGAQPAVNIVLHPAMFGMNVPGVPAMVPAKADVKKKPF